MFFRRPRLRAQYTMLTGKRLSLTVQTTRDGDDLDGIQGALEARRWWNRER